MVELLVDIFPFKEEAKTFLSGSPEAIGSLLIWLVHCISLTTSVTLMAGDGKT